jgi:hypothetical protein
LLVLFWVKKREGRFVLLRGGGGGGMAPVAPLSLHPWIKQTFSKSFIITNNQNQTITSISLPKEGSVQLRQFNAPVFISGSP